VKEGLAEGKALDLYQVAPIAQYSTKLTGSTNDYSATADSDVVVITSGSPRKPGMSREDLISINANIVRQVTENVVKHSPNAVIVVVANPLDTMTYHALQVAGFAKHRVVGMAGILDTARFRAFLAQEIGVSPRDIQAMLMGGHGDTMVPLPRYTTVSGIPITHFIKEERLHEIVERTKKGGGELTKLLGTSAWYAPGTAAAQMVETILLNEHRIFPCCTYLDGEYGLNDICVGVPIKLGRNGVEEIIQLELNQDEKELLQQSADAVRSSVQVLNEMSA
jgi:malate dehydrogenase